MSKSTASDPEDAEDDASVFITERQLVDRFGLSMKWAQTSRLRGDGVPYFKFGGKYGPVRYRLSDVKAFERRCARTSTSDSGTGN